MIVVVVRVRPARASTATLPAVPGVTVISRVEVPEAYRSPWVGAVVPAGHSLREPAAVAVVVTATSAAVAVGGMPASGTGVAAVVVRAVVAVGCCGNRSEEKSVAQPSRRTSTRGAPAVDRSSTAAASVRRSRATPDVTVRGR